MTDLLSATLFGLLVWWFSTGVILWLDRRSPTTFSASMLGATLALAIAVAGLAWSAGDPSQTGAYCAFAAAIVIWGWHEMAFLMGFVTGPRRSGCDAGCRGLAHFRHGIEAVLYHELALAVCAAFVLWLTWGGANQVGAMVFVYLWGLRSSAKLNLFLGVPNSGSEMLPPHLRYLESFFAIRSINLLFPVSVTVSTAIAALLWSRALSARAGSFDETAAALQATLVSLAVIEHWLMVLPFKSSALWAWYLKVDGASSRSGPHAIEHQLEDVQVQPIGVHPAVPGRQFSAG